MRTKRPSESAGGFIERALRRLAGREVGEAAWGDLVEMERERPRRRGRAAAGVWIFLQGLRLVVSLADWSLLLPARWFEEVIMDGWTDRQRRLVAIVGALAALPAALLVICGMVYIFAEGGAWARTLDATLFDPAGFFFRIVLHPAVILGGLALAVALNLLPLIRMQLERHAGLVSATVGLRLRPIHLAIAAAGLGLLTVILAYAFTENFDVVAREGTQALGLLAAAVV
jgi:hypothetical protein